MDTEMSQEEGGDEDDLNMSENKGANNEQRKNK